MAIMSTTHGRHIICYTDNDEFQQTWFSTAMYRQLVNQRNSTCNNLCNCLIVSCCETDTVGTRLQSPQIDNCARTSGTFVIFSWRCTLSAVARAVAKLAM